MCCKALEEREPRQEEIFAAGRDHPSAGHRETELAVPLAQDREAVGAIGQDRVDAGFPFRVGIRLDRENRRATT